MFHPGNPSAQADFPVFNVRPYTQLGKISQCLLINIMDFLIASGNHDK
jgi:hypothetical protein